MNWLGGTKCLKRLFPAGPAWRIPLFWRCRADLLVQIATKLARRRFPRNLSVPVKSLLWLTEDDIPIRWKGKPEATTDHWPKLVSSCYSSSAVSNSDIDDPLIYFIYKYIFIIKYIFILFIIIYKRVMIIWRNQFKNSWVLGCSRNLSNPCSRNSSVLENLPCCCCVIVCE